MNVERIPTLLPRYGFAAGLTAVLTLTGTSVWPACTLECIGTCGTPSSFCTYEPSCDHLMGSDQTEILGCCTVDWAQGWIKRYYDCDNDNDADCETRECSPQPSPICQGGDPPCPPS
jgi:hypothetical protein